MNSMDLDPMPKKSANPYTCSDYREEMILLGLRKRLARNDMTPGERERILAEIAEVEKKMGLD